MTSSRLFTLIGAVVFFLIAGINLWRLLVGFPITIGGVSIGATASFLAMCASGALGLMMLRETRRG